MTGNSRPVYSRQTASAEQLPALVRKHLQTQYQKPLHPFSQALFEQQPFEKPSSAREDEMVGTNFERKYRREGRTFQGMLLVRTT